MVFCKTPIEGEDIISNDEIRGFKLIIIYNKFYLFIRISGEYVSVNQCCKQKLQILCIKCLWCLMKFVSTKKCCQYIYIYIYIAVCIISICGLNCVYMHICTHICVFTYNIYICIYILSSTDCFVESQLFSVVIYIYIYICLFHRCSSHFASVNDTTCWTRCTDYRGDNIIDYRGDNIIDYRGDNIIDYRGDNLCKTTLTFWIIS